MEPAARTPDPHKIRAQLADADDALAAFIRLIRIQINNSGNGPLAAARIRKILRALLVPAEALLRRAIHVLAALMDPPKLRPARPPRPAPAAPPRSATRRPRLPSFRLTEAPIRARARYLPPSQRPRISVAGMAPEALPRPIALPEQIEARFLRRIEALERAASDPVREVRRLQRRLLRARAQGKPARRLREGRPPGLHPDTDPELLELFEQMSLNAARALDRLDTS